MNTDTALYITMLAGLFLGWLPAALTYRRKYVQLKKDHKIELSRTHEAGFESGWKSALNDLPSVKKSYRYHFMAK